MGTWRYRTRLTWKSHVNADIAQIAQISTGLTWKSFLHGLTWKSHVKYVGSGHAPLTWHFHVNRAVCCRVYSFGASFLIVVVLEFNDNLAWNYNSGPHKNKEKLLQNMLPRTSQKTTKKLPKSSQNPPKMPPKSSQNASPKVIPPKTSLLAPFWLLFGSPRKLKCFQKGSKKQPKKQPQKTHRKNIEK